MSISPRSQISVSIQDRDLDFLRGLFECRIMTIKHAAVLYFCGKKEYTKKRIQKLKSARLIKERARRVNEPSILSLTKESLELLKAHGVLSQYPALSTTALTKRANVSDLTIRHEQEVMDVKAAFHSALENHNTLSIAEFGTWPRLYEFIAQPNRSPVVVRPDGYIHIHKKEKTGNVSHAKFFLEVDRSTESQDKLASRAACYLDYYRSGGFALRNSAPRAAFKEHHFRVVMVFKTPERRNNMAERLLRNTPPILTQTYLTTIDQVRENVLGAIWLRPIDYRNALLQAGLIHYLDQAPRHSRERDKNAKIENILTFRSLFNGD